MTQQEPWTVLKLLDWTKGYLGRASVESPRLCSEILLAHSLGCKRMDLYTRFSYEPTAEQRDAFRAKVKQAAEGQPVAYLVGTKEFYSLPFVVTPEVLIPRPETELLVEIAIDHLRATDGDRMWDVCTGSGCVAVATAANIPWVNVLVTDISPAAVAIAAENARRNDVADRVTCAQADLLRVPESWDGGELFDVVTANPPYVAEGEQIGPGVDREPPEALFAGADGLDVLRPLIAGVADVLKPGGLFCVEFGATQADDVRDLLVATEAFSEPAIRKDLGGHERVAVARRLG
jgi:release factor glutamine methyltransferase